MSHSPNPVSGIEGRQQTAAPDLSLYSGNSDNHYSLAVSRSVAGPESHEPLCMDNGSAASDPAASAVANSQSQQSQQSQQQRAAPYVVSDRAAAAIGQSLIRALSGEDLLEEFLRKYPRPVPGSGVGVGPIKSTTQAPDAHGRLQRSEYHAKKQARLREKRQRLRALQDWEYQATITPARRANSATVGLYTFGFTFILLGLHYTGHFALDTVLPANGICFGGGLQLIAGLLSWTQGQTYAYVSFVSMGAFFLSLVCVWMLPNASFVTGSAVQEVSEYFMGAYLSVWGVVSFFLFICTPAMNLCLVVKSLATVLFFLCVAGGMMSNNSTAVHAGGYFAIIAGGASLYLSFAGLLNEVWDMHMLPVLQTAKVLDWIAHRRHGDTDAADDDAEEEAATGGSAGNVAVRTGSTGTKEGTVPHDSGSAALQQRQRGETTAAEASVPPAAAAAGNRNPVHNAEEDVTVDAPSLLPSDSD